MVRVKKSCLTADNDHSWRCHAHRQYCPSLSPSSSFDHWCWPFCTTEQEPQSNQRARIHRKVSLLPPNCDTTVSCWAPYSLAGRLYWVMYLQSPFLMRVVILNSNWVDRSITLAEGGNAIKGHTRLQAGVLEAVSCNKSESGSWWEIGSSPN